MKRRQEGSSQTDEDVFEDDSHGCPKCKSTNARLAEIDEKLERLLKFTDEFETYKSRTWSIPFIYRHKGLPFMLLAKIRTKIRQPSFKWSYYLRKKSQSVLWLPRRDFAQKVKSRGGSLVTRAYIKESTYSWNIQSYSQHRKKSRFPWTRAARNR